MGLHQRHLDDRHVRRGGVSDAQSAATEGADEDDAVRHGTFWSMAMLLTLLTAGSALVAAQAAPPAGAPQAAASPRTVAPIDLTGYWVSIVNEDWRWRMVTPDKG